MSAKKALSLAAASALAATALAIPTAGAAEQPQTYDAMMQSYLSSKDGGNISLKTEGEKCIITFQGADGKKETETITRAKARETLAEWKEISYDKEKNVRDLDKDTNAETDGETAKMISTIGALGLWTAKALAPVFRACADGKDMSPTSSKAHTLFSSVNGDLSPEGIGIIAGGTVVLLGLLAAVAQFALPAINPQLAAQLPF